MFKTLKMQTCIVGYRDLGIREVVIFDFNKMFYSFLKLILITISKCCWIKFIEIPWLDLFNAIINMISTFLNFIHKNELFDLVALFFSLSRFRGAIRFLLSYRGLSLNFDLIKTIFFGMHSWSNDNSFSVKGLAIVLASLNTLKELSILLSQ